MRGSSGDFRAVLRGARAFATGKTLASVPKRPCNREQR